MKKFKSIAAELVSQRSLTIYIYTVAVMLFSLLIATVIGYGHASISIFTASMVFVLPLIAFAVFIYFDLHMKKEVDKSK